MKISLKRTGHILFGLALTLVIVPYLPAQTSKLQINIDSPQFRPLAIAIPQVKHESANAKSIASTFETELARLLNFSGLFKVVGAGAYSHIETNDGEKGVLGKSLAWKNAGVEAVVNGLQLQPDSDNKFELSVFDLNSQKIMVKKTYEKVVDGVFLARIFGDAILEAYTGRPGLFTTKLVFIGRIAKGQDKQVFISDFDGGNIIQMTNDKVPHLSPSWSPDGNYIVYTSYKSGDPDLYQQNIHTRKVTKISGYQGIDSGGQYDNNSDLIAFSGAVKGDTDIYVVSKNGGERRVLIKGRGLDVDPAFSPNGKWLAYVSGRFGNPHIFRADLSRSTNNLKVLSDHRLTWAGWYNGTPAWSNDSNKIAFAGYDRETDRFDLFLVEPTGKNLERLTLRTGDNESPSWSPNSQLIVFHSNRKGTSNIKDKPQLWVMRRDGSNQTMLNVGLYEAQTPKWGPYVKKP